MSHVALNNEVGILKDGFYQLAKDKEALAVFLAEVKTKQLKFASILDKIKYLIEHNYYYNVFGEYTEEEVERIYEAAYAHKFEFQSYMAATKFYKDYSLRSDDKKIYLEDYEDRAAIVALYLASGNAKKALRYVNQIMKQNYQPATPTYLNSGKARAGELVSCFLLEMDDSLNSINYNLSVAKQLSKIGGGIAINLSKLRGRTEAIKGIENAASGVLPVMKLMEDSFSYINQLGQRPGAGAAYLNIFHWDLIEFLDSKKVNADEKTRIQSLSIGLVTPRKFFQLAEQNKEMYVFAPATVYKAYGVHLDDMDLDEKYEELVANPMVRKRKLDLTARDMLVKIATIQLESGYPYFMNKTNANEQHPLKDLGDVKMSNLCTEIFQYMETSVINDYNIADWIKNDISCVLGSLNIVNVMENKDVKEAVHTGMEMLTDVTDKSNIENAPGVKKANATLHSVGLGTMNLHGFLAKNFIPYESEDAKDFARVFFAMLNYHSIEKSSEIAKERGISFEGFEKSEYAKGTYFEKYLTTEFLPQSEKVKKLFEGIQIPTTADWERLMKQVQRDGLYHSYRLAIAPNQSSGYVQNATPSVMPIVDKVETRSTDKATTYYPMPYLSKQTFFSYKSAYEMDQMKVIDLIAEIQPHVDQGISCILHVTNGTSTRDLARYYIYAEKKGLKSLYYTRTSNSTIEECIACAV
ncbi:class 1b ribonucleoside-diphosphate reductase subunit alpha [Bacillus cereus group sp. N6]|uniref:class 1b ribonucleoside-diphosphate reductase subunit alpha n=1 Tax=Bacillus cereus group sp. N6 TaxID=2794583 RepID=UPI0018F3F506|nr:class 1b ribonucleoside-diphosphate reductase subunit alpha [Bacillus cereus group sp. N6]MBJ8108967.1 class 1b ribonucleoside-diphosphate reductase subunit alpha [Bacillus cereus group sp. N6]MDA1976951.1 class 1b ribonucleoside-diphosphate reductase subunit alpha [Bacillus cereus]